MAVRLETGSCLKFLFRVFQGLYPYVPIPSASGFGVGFGCRSTPFLQGIWSTRDKVIFGALEGSKHV